MATQPIWPGSGSFTDATNTPFSFYTDDATYVTHSVQTAEWCAKRLGYPIMDVELQGEQMYACFEEAVTEYSSIVNQYNIKENMLKLQGAPTSSNFTHTVSLPSERIGVPVNMRDNFAFERPALAPSPQAASWAA